MIEVLQGTKQADAMLWEWEHRNRGNSIEKAYSNPSETKRATFADIESRAKSTEGYNHDLKVVSRGSHYYSTMYSYTVSGITYLVKDTKTYTYRLQL